MSESTASKPRNKRRASRPDDTSATQISKACSYILRHGAEKEGVAIRSDGYVRVEDLLATPKLKRLKCDLDTLRGIVDTNDKNRFKMVFESNRTHPVDDPVMDNGLSSSNQPQEGHWWIRANQGHSVEVLDLGAVPIQSATDIPMAVHGTTVKAWEEIRISGLSRMKRNHIHMAKALADDQTVVSGMRPNSAILVFVDMEKAMQAGIQFLESSNGVILSPGDERGYIPASMFKEVLRRRGGETQRWNAELGEWNQA